MGAKAQKSGIGLGGLGAQTLGQKSNQTRTGASVPRRSALTDISNQNFVPDEVSQAKKVDSVCSNQKHRSIQTLVDDVYVDLMSLRNSFRSFYF